MSSAGPQHAPQKADKARAERADDPLRVPLRATSRLAARADAADLAGLTHPNAVRGRAAAMQAIQRRRGNDYAQRAIDQAAVDRALADGSPGRSLEPGVRATMERRLRTPLPDVAVHTGSAAAGLASDLDAAAFTRGSDVYFGAGRYAPGTPAGEALLAHELVHVLQQAAGEVDDQAGRVVAPDHPSEARAARAETGRQPPGAGAVAHAIQRQPLEAPVLEVAPDRPEVLRGLGSFVANAVSDALWGPNDVPAALEALRGRSKTERDAIQTAFKEKHDGLALDDYLIDQLDGEDLINALALLHEESEQTEVVALAFALLRDVKREDEVLRILEAHPLDGRKLLEAQYDAAFGKLGEGTLKQDIVEELSGWREEKAVATLDRDLTAADHLYFHSRGISGTHSESVVAIFQKAWAERGVAGIRELNQQWDELVIGRSGWTQDHLRTAMEWELLEEREAWEFVRAILDESATAKPGTLTASEQEDLDLKVAKATYEAATTGGWTGAGTTEEQAFNALATIRNVWEKRIARAGEDTEPGRKLRSQWELERDALLAAAPAEMDESSPEYARADLLLRGKAGGLSDADEVWLADRAGDRDRVDALLVRIWAGGRINQFLKDAMRPQWFGTGKDARRLRPEFDPASMTAASSKAWKRAYPLVREDWTDTQRGAGRLAYEFYDGTPDSVRQFLATDELSPLQRRSVVAQFATDELKGAGTTQDKVDAFLREFRQRNGPTSQYWDLRDLLWDPLAAVTPDELVERAEGRLKASHSGFLNWLLDSPENEDLERNAEESLARLRHIATDATDAEIAALAGQMGGEERRSPLLERDRVTATRGGATEPVSEPPRTFARAEVAAVEYELFKARLQVVVDEKKALAEAMATIVEIAVSALVTAFTAGAAGGLLLASISSAVLGMLARKALLGDEYELFSEQNYQRLVEAAGGAALGTVGSDLAKGFELLAERFPRLAPAMQNATQELFGQLGSRTAAAAFSSNVPTVDSIAQAVGETVVSMGGAGLSGAIRADSEKARTMLLGNLVQNAVTAGGQDLADLAAHGMGDETGGDRAKSSLKRQRDAAVNAVGSTLGELGAARVKKDREARAAAAERRRTGEDVDVDEGLPPPKTTDETPPHATADLDEEATPTPKPKPRPGRKHGPKTQADAVKEDLARARRLLDREFEDSARKDFHKRWFDEVERLLKQGETDEAWRKLERQVKRLVDDVDQQRPGTDRAAALDDTGMQDRETPSQRLRNLEGLRVAPEIDPQGPLLAVEQMTRSKAELPPAFYKEQADLVANRRLSATELGIAYEALLKRYLPKESTIGRPGRRPDIGMAEITIEGVDSGLGRRKLRQLWVDITDLAAVRLYVPRMGPEAEHMVRRVAAEAEAMIKRDLRPGRQRRVTVEIIETER
jgi:hypothetical protein